MMSYESWRISFQSSEQAARAAYDQVVTLQAELAKRGEAVGLIEPIGNGKTDALMFTDTLPEGTELFTGPKVAQVGYLPVKREILEGLVFAWNKKSSRRYGSPNHCHNVRGIWDSDNGELAGKPCAECAIYDEARALLTAAPQPEAITPPLV